MNYIFLVLPLILPLLGALCVASSKIVKDRYMKPFVAVVVILNFVFTVNANMNSSFQLWHILTVNEFLDIYLHIDQLGKLFSYMAGFLWIITCFYSFEYMKHEGKERQYFTFFILTLGMIMGIAYAGNLFTLYIYYELLTLSTFPLVIHANSDEALVSGKKYIIYSFMGATFIILGMMILYSISGDMTFIGGGISSLMAYPEKKLLLVSFLSMFIGFGVKAAMVPFHSWLPAAMVAPTPVSALLHAVAVVKSGIFALMRITYFIYGPTLVKAIGGDSFLIPVVIITIVMGSMLALHQDHMKKRLAYSTISQLGYIILGILMLNPNGLLGAILHMINHAFLKITLFFVVGAITYMTGHKYVHQIKGLGKRMPKTFIAFTVAAISLTGIPPTNGFVSKWFLGMGALDANNLLYIVILLFSAFLTAAYLLPISIAGLFKISAEAAEVNEGHGSREAAVSADSHMTDEATSAIESLDPPKMMMVPILILTLVTIGLGLFPNPVIEFIDVIIQGVF